MSEYCILTPKQQELFRQDKPYNSPFKNLPWYEDCGIKSGGYHTTSMGKIMDAARDYWDSRDWN